MSASRIPNQRAIVDRRGLTDAIGAAVQEHGGGSAARPRVVELLRATLAAGRAEIARRLADKPSAGHDIAEAQAFLIDQVVRIIHDHVVGDVYRASNRSSGERLSYNRSRMRCPTHTFVSSH